MRTRRRRCLCTTAKSCACAVRGITPIAAYKAIRLLADGLWTRSAGSFYVATLASDMYSDMCNAIY